MRHEKIRLPEYSDVIDAQTRLRGVAMRTPLLSAPQIDEIAGRRVWVKAESLQRTGSFKFRGAWNRLRALKDSGGPQNVVAYSSGNHAQAVAYSAQRLGLNATIVMPADAPEAKLSATKGYGAQVVTYDRATESREDIGGRIQQEQNAVLVPPFDDPLVIAGQGSCGLEIAEQAQEAEPDMPLEVLVCCGGGGLTAGIALALDGLASNHKVRPVEPSGFDDFNRSLIANERLSNPQNTGSIQDALLTVTPGVLTFDIAQRLFGSGLNVTDEETLKAMALAWRWMRLTLEPGGAAALAAALFRPQEITGEAVAVLASGGNVDPAIFISALERL